MEYNTLKTITEDYHVYIDYEDDDEEEDNDNENNGDNDERN